MSQVEYVIRREGQGTYGLGEVIIPGVALFRAGDGWQHYNLTYDELQVAVNKHKQRANIKEQKR